MDVVLLCAIALLANYAYDITPTTRAWLWCRLAWLGAIVICLLAAFHRLVAP